MDKEKQIEEMYQIFLNYKFSMPAEDFSYKGMCENFIDNNYRKINDNEVVISKEEKQKLLKGMYEQGKFDAIADLEKEGKVVIIKDKYERLNKLFTYDKPLCDRIFNFVTEIKEKTRKETAREIFNALYKDTLRDGRPAVYNMLTPKKIKDMAKQFGVEIGEE